MLTQAQNDALTRVGSGVPAGEFLRRYWQPVAAGGELTEDKPIKPGRCRGEDLVVYKDKSGDYGLIGERCSPRRTSLAFGRVEAGRQGAVIELKVINERIGLITPEK